MSSLDLDFIHTLLKEDSSPTTRKSSTGTSTNSSGPWPRPVQLGFLRWANEAEPCVSRNCRAPTLLRIFGAPKCATHALYELNYILLQSHSDFEDVAYSEHDCTCQAGKLSRLNIHTHDCALFERVKAFNNKEQSDSDNTESSASNA